MKSIVTPGATHQREAEGIVGARPPYPLLTHRPDVLVFQTEPLGTEIEITGQVVVESWVSSSAVDTDFTAKLMEAGEVYPVQITLPPTSNHIMPGHRIRLDISSSNFPRFDLNPNTGEPMGRHTHTLVAMNMVWVDADHPSKVMLPVIQG